MDGRKDQIVLIQQRHTGLIACGIRRIECEVGEEPLAGWVARRDLFKLYKVRLPNGGVLINAFEVRFKRSDASHFFMCAVESATKRRETADFDRPDPAGDGTCPSGGNDQSSPEEKIILLGLPDGLRQCWQIRTLPRVQRDEFLLCTSKFESDIGQPRSWSPRSVFRMRENRRAGIGTVAARGRRRDSFGNSRVPWRANRTVTPVASDTSHTAISRCTRLFGTRERKSVMRTSVILSRHENEASGIHTQREGSRRA
jgi:hypothetical protein